MFKSRQVSKSMLPISKHTSAGQNLTQNDRFRSFQLSLSAHVTAVCRSGYTSCASCSWLSGRCLKTRVRHYSRHSFPAAWTTATRCSSASPKDWWTGCSRFRRPLPVWWPVLDAPTISLVLRHLHWLPVRQRVHFKVATFVHQSLSGISPSYLADDCRLVADARSGGCVFHSEPNMRRDSWHGHTAPSATERSRLPAPVYGTVFHRTWKTLTYRTRNSGGC